MLINIWKGQFFEAFVLSKEESYSLAEGGCNDGDFGVGVAFAYFIDEVLWNDSAISRVDEPVSLLFLYS